MSVATPLAVAIAILFLVPGLIWRKMARVASAYAVRKKVGLLECLMLSCLNYLFALPFVYFLIDRYPDSLHVTQVHTFSAHAGYLLFWGLVIFAWPAVLAYCSAKLAQGARVKGFLKRFGLSTIHPAPTAWDYAFARDERYWARIRLTDGEMIEGLFDSNSLASSESDERDVFLEDVYEFDSNDMVYRRVERNAGVLVRSGCIASITFLEVDQVAIKDAADSDGV